MRLARRRAYEQTEEFKDRYRWRAGIEATMSEYDRRTGVKQLRIRGLKSVRFCATLKAIGVNIFRATASRMAQSQDNTGHEEYKSCLNRAIFIIKEHFVMTLSHLKKIYSLYLNHYEYKLAMVA